MANSYFTQFRYSKEKKVCDLFAKVTFGASGAPTLSAVNSKGVASISRNSAGDYTITLRDGYQKLLMVRHIFDTSGPAAAPAAPGMYIKASTITTNTGGTLRIVFNSAGTPTDPASGEIVYLQLEMNDTTAY